MRKLLIFCLLILFSLGVYAVNLVYKPGIYEYDYRVKVFLDNQLISTVTGTYQMLFLDDTEPYSVLIKSLGERVKFFVENKKIFESIEGKLQQDTALLMTKNGLVKAPLTLRKKFAWGLIVPFPPFNNEKVVLKKGFYCYRKTEDGKVRYQILKVSKKYVYWLLTLRTYYNIIKVKVKYNREENINDYIKYDIFVKKLPKVGNVHILITYKRLL